MWSSPRNSSTEDAQISMPLKTCAILTRVGKPMVSGPKAHSHSASSGALVEMRAQLDLGL